LEGANQKAKCISVEASSAHGLDGPVREAIVTEPPLKKQGFFLDPIEGFSTERECTNTHISIQFHDI
jgi:hypothetical protein